MESLGGGRVAKGRASSVSVYGPEGFDFHVGAGGCPFNLSATIMLASSVVLLPDSTLWPEYGQASSCFCPLGGELSS